MPKRNNTSQATKSSTSKRRKTQTPPKKSVPSPPSTEEDEEEEYEQKPIIKLDELRSSVQSPAFIAYTKLIAATPPVTFSKSVITNFLFGDETTAKHLTAYDDQGQDMFDNLAVGGCYSLETEAGAVKKHRYPKQCLGYDNIMLRANKTTCTLLTNNASRKLDFVKKGLKWNFVGLLEAQETPAGTELDVCGLINTVTPFQSKNNQQGYIIKIGSDVGMFMCNLYNFKLYGACRIHQKRKCAYDFMI